MVIVSAEKRKADVPFSQNLELALRYGFLLFDLQLPLFSSADLKISSFVIPTPLLSTLSVLCLNDEVEGKYRATSIPDVHKR